MRAAQGGAADGGVAVRGNAGVAHVAGGKRDDVRGFGAGGLEMCACATATFAVHGRRRGGVGDRGKREMEKGGDEAESDDHGAGRMLVDGGGGE